MKRSFLTLGASVLALAMTNGPAWAARAAAGGGSTRSWPCRRARWRSTLPCEY